MDRVIDSAKAFQNIAWIIGIHDGVMILTVTPAPRRVATYVSMKRAWM